ncbi:MAG: hypothetical protein Q9198_003757 [Flavoplaca austrocitrina]
MSRVTPTVRSLLRQPYASQWRQTPVLRSSQAWTKPAHQPIRCLATPAAMPKVSKENIGVYCNPAHDLWVKESGPSMNEVKTGEALKEGEVTIAIKSTAQTFTSGATAASALWLLSTTTSWVTNPPERSSLFILRSKISVSATASPSNHLQSATNANPA